MTASKAIVKAAEIRVGNLFNVPNTAQSPFRVDTIEYLQDKESFGKVGMFVKRYENLHPLTWYLENLEPIPLTEEWLLKANFKKIDSLILPIYAISISTWKNVVKELGVTVEPGNQYMNIREGEVDRDRDEDDVIMLRNSDIHGTFYVHQLQNIYFALTATELEFKLN
jgi:hypothetical protein